MAKRKYAKVVVRKGSLTENLFLTRNCGWTADWKKAARFATQAAAITAARRCKVGANYGLFPTSPNPIRHLPQKPKKAHLPFWARPEPEQARDRPVPRAAQRWAEKWDLPQD